MEYFKGGIGNIKFNSYISLGEISEKIQSGSTPSGGNFEKEGILYLKSADFDLFEIQKSQFITKTFHEKLNRSKIIKGDILLASVGATIGKVGYYNLDEQANINQNVARIRIIDKRFIDKYVTIFLYSDLGQKQLLGNSTVNAQPYINNQKISELKIPLISLEKQNQIVEKMDSALTEKKEKEMQAKTLLESIDDFVLSELGIEYKEVEEKKVFGLSLSELLESNRLDPKGYSVKFREIKNSIKNSKYKLEIIEKLTLQSIAGERGVDEGKGGEGFEKINVLRNTNFVNDKNFDYSDVAIREIEKKKFSKGILLNKGDLLVEKSGGSEVQPVGRIAIFDLEDKNYSFSNFLHCFRIDKDKILPDYVFSYLKTIYRLGYMEYIQNQTTGIRNLIMENFLEILIPLPPLEIQEKIALEVKSRIEKAKVLESEAKEVYERAKREVEEMILD